MRDRARVHSLPIALSAALCALAVASAPAAGASRVIAPPGNSGVSQYVEVVPSAGGSTPVGGRTSRGPVLSAAQRTQLEAAGASGKALASFVSRTGVAHAKRGRAEQLSAAARSTRASAGKASPSLPAAVPARSSGSPGGGLGWGLFAALAAVTLAAAAIAIGRRRRAV